MYEIGQNGVPQTTEKRMSGKQHFVFTASVGIFITLAGAIGAYSQLTIINTPSTDTLQAKMFYLEADVGWKPGPYRNGGFQSYGYRTVYGLNRKTEVGVSFFYSRNGTTSPKELQLSVKRKLYSKEKWGLASSAGATMYVPLNKSAGKKSVILAYANISKTVSRLRGLRITGGGYQIINNERGFGTRRGVMIGIEQPLTKRLSVVGDYVSGKNRFGYAAAGVVLALTKKQTLMISYNFSNVNGSGNYLNFLWSITF